MDASGNTTIRVDGSDTMVNLAQAWAEEYNRLHPEIVIQVSGGGSGVGIANLINGESDFANSSRKMKDKELERAKSTTGKEPKEFVVGIDALAIYVHPDNPLETISLAELADPPIHTLSSITIGLATSKPYCVLPPEGDARQCRSGQQVQP